MEILIYDIFRILVTSFGTNDHWRDVYVLHIPVVKQ